MRKRTKHQILKDVGEIADSLNIAIWLVGGAVRDDILGVENKDLDFVILADAIMFAQEIVNRLGANSLVMFERFGTAMVMLDNYQLEFVTARKESYGEDSRKPQVMFSNLEEDLKRRDFTINAMAMSLNGSVFGNITDLFNGREDIDNKIIRTPIDPIATFSDDPLRIMRAVRFATRLGFQIDKDTFVAMKMKHRRLSIVSQERIMEELKGIIQTVKPSEGIDLLRTIDVLGLVIPELERTVGVEQRSDYHHKDVYNHTLLVLDEVSKLSDKFKLRFAALMHDIGKPVSKRFVKGIGWTFHGHEDVGSGLAVDICKRLKMSNELLKYVSKMVKLHMRPARLVDSGNVISKTAMRRILIAIGDEDIDDLFLLSEADVLGGQPSRTHSVKSIRRLLSQIYKMKKDDEIDSNFKSPINGKEIMKVLNVRQGVEVGEIKKQIEEAIINSKIKNTYDEAYEYLLSIKNDLK